MRKIIILLFVISGLSLSAQNTGYLGKQLRLGVDFKFEPLITFDSDNHFNGLEIRPEVLMSLSNRFAFVTSLGIKDKQFTQYYSFYDDYYNYITQYHEFDFNGLDLDFELRYYPKSNGIPSPVGKFYAINVGVPIYSITNLTTGSEFKVNSFSMGMKTGKSWVLYDYITVEAVVGIAIVPEVIFEEYTNNYYLSDDQFDGVSYMKSLYFNESIFHTSLKFGYLAL